MRKGASYWSQMTFSFVLPLLETAYEADFGENLTVEQMGELPGHLSIEETANML